MDTYLIFKYLDRVKSDVTLTLIADRMIRMQIRWLLVVISILLDQTTEMGDVRVGHQQDV
jgi:hypothetical protein